MKKLQLDRALELTRRTGDKFLIFDRETDEIFSLLSLDDYENLLSGREPVEDLSEREMLDRVNRELANWRAYREAEGTGDFEPVLEENDLKPILPKEPESEEPVFIPEPSKMAEQSQKTPQFSSSEVSLSDVPVEEEEEKFYLEPVE